MNMPENGDVICVNRGLYSHYGIYIEEGRRVIHYTGATGPNDFNGVVRETSLDEFLNGTKNFNICKFPEKPPKNLHFLHLAMRKRGLFKIWQIVKNMMLKDYHLYSGEQTIERARSKIGQGGYNIALNNCEHFAVWCKTGVKNSSQVNQILDIITYLLS